jgi:2-hydroxychromene-2-carboxylate isomerase
MGERTTFYYDLGSPYAYLTAERVNGLFAERGAEVPEWQPILLGGLFQRFERSSWGLGPDREAGMAECERRASAYGLPPIRWPEGWPGNYLYAMRVATYAKEIGRAVAFSLAAFRQAFVAGQDLSVPDNVLIAAAAAEMHPRAIVAAVERQSLKDALRAATDRAADAGVFGVPSLALGGEVYWGDDRLDDAVEASAAA